MKRIIRPRKLTRIESKKYQAIRKLVEAEYPPPKNLYDVAKRICHEHGFSWTDPRTLKKYPPPKK